MTEGFTPVPVGGGELKLKKPRAPRAPRAPQPTEVAPGVSVTRRPRKKAKAKPPKAPGKRSSALSLLKKRRAELADLLAKTDAAIKSVRKLG